MSSVLALALLASGAARAANPLNLGDQTVTLAWDAAWQAYSYYGQFTCTYGQPYVFWVTGGDNSYMSEAEAADGYSTKTSFRSLTAGGITYHYVAADGWKAVDAGSSHLFNFNTLFGKTSCSVVVHVRQANVMDFVPVGSSYKPEQLDFSTPGSCQRTQLPGEFGYFFRADIKANVNYTLTSSLGAVDFVVDDESASVSRKAVPGGFSFVSDRASSVMVRVSAAAGQDVDLAWRFDDVGRVGFVQTGYAVGDTVGFATVTVTRTSADFAGSVKWYTVAETADPGVNYLPAEGRLEWEKGDKSPRPIALRILPDLHPSDRDDVTFAIRLVPDDETVDPAHQPVLLPDITRVTIRASGDVEPEPVVPPAEDDEPGRCLAEGTFEGVLAGGTGDSTTNGVWALGALTLAADAAGELVATLTINGEILSFSGRDGELTGVSACAGMVNRLTVRLPSGTVGDLAAGPLEGAEISATVYLNLNGQPVEATYDGTAYRTENRRYSVTMDRVRGCAGRYTVALGGDRQLGAPSGYGYLSFGVTPAGEVTGLGRLADGTSFDFTAFANETPQGLAIPIIVTSGTSTFGGTLVIEGGAARGTLLWCNDLPHFGGDGEQGFRMELSPAGGRYDATARLEAQYFGWLLSVNDRASAFRDLTLAASGETFVAAFGGFAVDFVRATGVLRVIGDGVAFDGILLPTIEDGALAVAGCELTADGDRACELFAAWTDPVQPEYRGYSTTVTFNLNGGSGDVAPITREVGGEAFLLPVEGEHGIGLTDRTLAGWERSDTHELYSPGLRLHPPIQDITLTAVWSRKLDIAEALGCTYLDFLATGSEKIWVEDVDEHPQPGERCIRNESLLLNETAKFAAVLKGAGTLIFKYRVSGSDSFTVTLDGKVILSKEASVGWTPFSYAIAEAGNHKVEFAFKQTDRKSTAGAAWLAALGYGTPVTVTLDPNDGGALSEMTKIAGRPFGTLPVLTSTLRDFAGWVNKASGAPVTESTTVMAGGMALVAQWEPHSWRMTFSAPDATSGTVPDPIDKKEDETVRVPGAGTLEKTSYEFVGWSDGVDTYAPGAEYTFGAKDVTMTAVWKFATRDIARALGCDYLDFGVSGDSNWFVDDATTSPSGSPTVRSGVLPNAESNKRSILSTVLHGGGELRFSYKVGNSSSGLSVMVDNVTIVPTVTSCDWTEVVYPVEGACDHTLQFVYASPGSRKPTTACAWLADMSFGTVAPVTFDYADGRAVETVQRLVGKPIGTLPQPTSAVRDFVGWRIRDGEAIDESEVVPEGGLDLVASWNPRPWTVTFLDTLATSGKAPDPVTKLEGEEMAVPDCGTLSRTQCAFKCWNDGTSDWNEGATFTFGTNNVTMTPVWSFLTTGIAAALGYGTDADYALTGDAPWRPANPGARSGELVAGQESVLSVSLGGCGILSFDYRVSSFVGNSLTVTLDGTEVLVAADGDVGPVSVTNAVTGAGAHTVAFRYAKTVENAGAEDLAWVGNLAYLPAAWVSFDPGYGGVVSNALKAVGEPVGELPQLPDADHRRFVGWQDASGAEVTSATTVPEEGLALTAVWDAMPFQMTFVNVTSGVIGECPGPLFGKEGETVTVPDAGTLEKASYEFVGWSDGGATYAPGAEYTLGAQDVTMTAVWKFSTRDIARTLGAENVEFETTEVRGWVVDGSRVRSNNKGQASTTSTLTARFSGAGTLTFRYQVSSYQNSRHGRTEGNDYLVVSVDGSEVYRGCGDGSAMTYPETHFGEGDHMVVWSFEKDASFDGNDDCGYVYSLTWTPDGPNPPQIDGHDVDPAEVVASMDSRKKLTLDADFAQVSGNIVTYGAMVMTFPGYYLLTTSEPTGGKVVVTVALDPAVATPQVDGSADSPIEVGDEVSVSATNVKSGLWYYLKTTPTLDADFALCEESVIQASGSSGKLVLKTERTGNSLFMKIGVCDYDPRRNDE